MFRLSFSQRSIPFRDAFCNFMRKLIQCVTVRTSMHLRLLFWSLIEATLTKTFGQRFKWWFQLSWHLNTKFKFNKRPIKKITVLPGEHIVYRIVDKRIRKSTTEYLMNCKGRRSHVGVYLSNSWKVVGKIWEALPRPSFSWRWLRKIVSHIRERFKVNADCRFIFRDQICRWTKPFAKDFKPEWSSAWKEITEEDFYRGAFQPQTERTITNFRTEMTSKIVFPILVQLSLGRSPVFIILQIRNIVMMNYWNI